MTAKHIDSPMLPLPPPSIINGALACLLMFLGGSVLALGVFTVPLEQEAYPPGSLNGVWSSAIGLVSFASIPVTILTGFFLDAPVSPSFSRSGGTQAAWKTLRIRILSFLTSLSYASMAIIGLGVQTGNPSVIRVAVLFQSIPLGIIYLLATEVLVRWNPSRPGLAVGLGQMALGSGTIVIASIYQSLVFSLGCVTTVCTAALLLAIATLLPTLFLRWPDEHEVPSACNKASEDTELTESVRSVRLGWRLLCRSRAFWLYVFVTFTSAAPQALVVFFFKLGFVYGRGSGMLLGLFQMTNVLSTTFGVVGIFLTDIAKCGDGRWFSGAKNLMTAYLAIQTAGFVALGGLTRGPADFGPFVAVVMVLVTMMAACCGSGAVLARELFGAANSMVVFGFGSGLGVGAGEGVGTLVMAFVESGGFGAGGAGSEVSPRSYQAFYVAAAVWSFVGLVCIARLGRCEVAFERRTETGGGYGSGGRVEAAAMSGREGEWV